MQPSLARTDALLFLYSLSPFAFSPPIVLLALVMGRVYTYVYVRMHKRRERNHSECEERRGESPFSVAPPRGVSLTPPPPPPPPSPPSSSFVCHYFSI